MYLPAHKGRKIFLAVVALGVGMFLVNRYLPQPGEPVPSAPPGGPAPTVPAVPVREVSRKSLAWVSDHFEFEKQPFTGVAIEKYPDGKMKQRWPMEAGKWHGLVEEWYPSGQASVATNFEHGQRNGENTYWNPDGSVQKKQVFDHDKLIEPPPTP